MAQTPTPPHDHDDAWFDALVGKVGTRDAASARDVEEAQRLRQALMDLDRAQAASEAPEDLAQDWERLRFRLNKEKLLRPRAMRPSSYWAIAASVMLVVAVALFVPKYVGPPDDELIRGGGASAIVMRVNDPAETAARIIRIGKDAGIDVQRRDDSSGAVLLDLEMPATPPAALIEVFKEQQIEPPAMGKVTLVVIRAP